MRRQLRPAQVALPVCQCDLAMGPRILVGELKLGNPECLALGYFSY